MLAEKVLEQLKKPKHLCPAWRRAADSQPNSGLCSAWGQDGIVYIHTCAYIYVLTIAFNMTFDKRQRHCVTTIFTCMFLFWEKAVFSSKLIFHSAHVSLKGFEPLPWQNAGDDFMRIRMTGQFGLANSQAGRKKDQTWVLQLPLT